MADDVGMTYEEYWDQIIKACYLDYENPVIEWEKTISSIEEISQKLSDMKIQYIHMV
jgi:leucyl aminopeptidase (aminopeptidase T)